jgi:hypothetical protein
MIIYEQCMKANVMLTPPLALNRWPQEEQRTWGQSREDHTTNIEEAPNGCDGRDGKRANIRREDDGIS